MYHQIEAIFREIVQYCILGLECVGVSIVVVTAIRSIIGMFKSDPHVPLKLAQGITLALQFKLGGEVLRTVIVRDWSELAILGAIIILRAGLMILIHWEIKNEQSHFA